METTNKRNFGKQAGDLRDCADHRLALLQRALIKSNCGGVLSAAVITIIFPLLRICSHLALTCAVQSVAPTIVADAMVTAVEAHCLRAVVRLAVLLARCNGLLQTHIVHSPPMSLMMIFEFIISYSAHGGREFFVIGVVLQAWNALFWPRHCRRSNRGVILREARADGSAFRT